MDREESNLAFLNSLSQKKQLAFALLAFERMLPSLIAFSTDTGFDDSCYLQARDSAWAILRGRNVDRSLNEVCLSNAPDTEAFTHPLTSYALNAALAISDILEFTLDGRVDHIAYVSTLAMDSVHLYLSSLSSSVISSFKEDRRIADHPLMRQEARAQEEDIKFLAGLSDAFDIGTVSELRTRASSHAPLLPAASLEP